MNEIVERRKGATLWRGVDAEGRKTYAVTCDRDGVVVEPTYCVHYTKIAAWAAGAAALAMERAFLAKEVSRG